LMVAKLATAGDNKFLLENPDECGEMRWLRYQACKAGESALKLHEMYIPSCDDMGTKKNVQYLVMPYAGPTAIEKLMKNPIKDVATQKTLFAQLVASLYAMHSVGAQHNDLNGGNVIIDGDRLALIDFGLVKKIHCKSPVCLRGQNRDGNAVFRWAAILATCKKSARYNYRAWWFKADHIQQKRAQSKCLRCLREKWGVDDKFAAALQVVFDANLKESPEHGILGLFDTDFVQEHLPKMDSRYKLPGTDQCHTWDEAKLSSEMDKNGAIELQA